MSPEQQVPFWRGVLNLLLALARLLPSPALWAGVALLVVVVRMAAGYADGQVSLTLVVDGVPQRIYTRRTMVGQVVDDMGIAVRDWDRLSPSRDTVVQRRMQIAVQHARAVTLAADGVTRTVYTHSRETGAILDEAGLDLRSGDQLWVNGQLAVGDRSSEGGLSLSELQVHPAAMGRAERAPDERVLSPVSHIEIRRATRISVHDGGIVQTMRTTASTLGQAIAESGIVVYLGDRVSPDLNTPVRAGLHVRIERGVPVAVLVDGRTARTRTHSQTVSDVLAELGVLLVGKDFVVPASSDRVRPGLEIVVSRITEKLAVKETEIPFETEWLADSLLEIDHRRVDAVGANGIQRRRYRAVYQNGQEIERRLEDEWVAREPETRKIAYGTKIVVRTLETPDGPIEYWRRIPVFLTSYTEATCGKTPDDPWYGLTRLGWKMRHGIIAVDPLVINMLSELYVPGYGRGTAADTGGLIIGRHIDLGHEVDDFVMWFEWGYVYILTPVPPQSQVRWILPDFPRGRWP